jgi:hypothetical protein
MAGHPLPLYAVHRFAPGRWLLVAPDDDPSAPAIQSVAVLEEPSYFGAEKQRGGQVIRLQPNTTKTRGDYSDHGWRSDLLQIARLLDHLASQPSQAADAWCGATH